MKNSTIAVIVLIVLVTLLFAEPAFAGPGGRIARAAFESFWGKVFLGVLAIVFMPLIIYVIFLEKIAERRARKDMQYMAAYSSRFEWLKIQERVKDCFYRVHSGWEKEDLSGVTNWMTSWYWQNQQQLYLEKWKRKGLVNICDVKKISDIRPLLFVHRNDGQEHEDSMVVISILANMQDYLQDRNTGKVEEGSKRYKDVETIWSFTMEDGEWKVSDIEEGNMSLAYAKLVKELPDIETTLITESQA